MDGPQPTDPRSTRAARRMMVRLAAPVVAVSLLLLAVGVIGAWSVHRLQRDVTALMTQDVASVRAAEELVITLRQIETLLDQFLLTGAPGHLAAIAAQQPETERWLAEAERLAASAPERARLEAIRSAHGRFWQALARARGRAGAEPIEEAIGDLEARVLTEQLLEPCQDHLDAREQEVARVSAQNQALPTRVALGLLLLGTCGAGAGLLAGFGIARGIGRSIAQLSVPIRDAAGKLSEVVGPIRLSPAWDVADLEGLLRRVSAEIGTVVDRLEHSRREVLRAEQLAALGQMAAGLAHELRNPLTAMKILVQSAAERGDAAGLRGRGLAVLDEEIRRLEAAIQAFLDFARPPQVEKRAFALRPVLDQLLDLVAPRAELKDIRIEREVPSDPVVLVADAGQIRQVLLNLLLNALDATPGGGTIAVGVDRDPAGVVIRVVDGGSGLPEGLVERIFEPFVSTKETGLGLGLSICKRIVEAHGGTIRAADRPEGGAVFTVLLPPGEADAPEPRDDQAAGGR